MKERQPPHAAEQERAILGAIIRQPEVLGLVKSALTPEDFFVGKNRIIYRTMLEIHERQGSIDEPMLCDEILGTEKERKAGGLDYILDLKEGATPAHAEWYMDKIREKAALRAVLGAFQEGIDEIYNSNGEAGKGTLAALQERLIGLFTERKRGRARTEHIGTIAARAMQILEEIGGEDGPAARISSGYPGLDRRIGGFAPGKLYILAGRPSHGKSTFALNLARNISVNAGIPGMIFSLEMDRDEITENLIAAQARIDNQSFRAGIPSARLCEKAADAANFLQARPLYINDRSSVGWSDIRADFLLQNAVEPVKYVIVDYLQLMATNPKAERRDLALGEVTRHLKVFAGEMQVPVILLSQLNRSVEGREGNRPRLSDLRESGSIEQDADAVMFIHRPGLYRSEQDMDAELILGKNRGGPIGKVELVYLYANSRFESRALGGEENE